MTEAMGIARLADAAGVLVDEFGPHVELEYLSGKTAFRDLLYARLGLSMLEAEEMCDALERAGLVTYREADEGSEETAGFTIVQEVPQGEAAPPVG